MERARHSWHGFSFCRTPRLESCLCLWGLCSAPFPALGPMPYQEGLRMLLLSKALFILWDALKELDWEGVWERCSAGFLLVPAAWIPVSRILSTHLDACFVSSLLFCYLGGSVGKQCSVAAIVFCYLCFFPTDMFSVSTKWK